MKRRLPRRPQSFRHDDQMIPVLVVVAFIEVLIIACIIAYAAGRTVGF